MIPARAAILSEVIDPDARAWKARAEANGGAPSYEALRSRSQLIRRFKSAGLWEKLIDFTVMDRVPGDLGSALTKIKSPIGVSGYLINNNFVSADLGNTGLKGDATSKWLAVGTPQSATTFADLGLGVYAVDMETSTDGGFIGARTANNSSSSHNVIITTSGVRVGAIGESWSSPTNHRINVSGSASAFEFITRTSATSCIYYRNGAQIGSDTNTASGMDPTGFVLFSYALNGSTGGVYSAMRMRAYVITRGLSASEASVLAGILNDHFREIGANVY